MGINLSLQVGHEKNFKKAEELNKKENAQKNKKGKEKEKMKERKKVRRRSREHWKGSKLAHDPQHT